MYTKLSLLSEICKQSQIEGPPPPDPLPEDYIDPPTEVPKPSGSRPRRHAQLPLRFRDTGLNSYLPGYMSQARQREEAAVEEVQNLPPDPDNPDVENVVAEILVYSDATRLAQFGTASAHPIYFFFGNLSKYIRCQPGSHAAHHGAYFPEVRSD